MAAMARRPEQQVLVPELADDRAKALELVDVSRETIELLDRFVEFLLPWTQKTNLIARSTIPTLWTRHIADSAQLLAQAPEAKVWIDLGPGAGFPGLVIACALAGRRGAAVHLVESVGKKANFLRAAAEHLGVPAVIHNVRIEDFGKNFKEDADVVSARALAPLDKLLHLASPMLHGKAVGLFPKGQDVDAELTGASKYWNIETELVPSLTSRDSRIVVVRKLAPRHLKM